jgi:hypothetical protein
MNRTTKATYFQPKSKLGLKSFLNQICLVCNQKELDERDGQIVGMGGGSRGGAMRYSVKSDQGPIRTHACYYAWANHRQTAER